MIGTLTERKKQGAKILQKSIRKYRKDKSLNERLIEIYSITDAETETLYRVKNNFNSKQLHFVKRLNDDLCSFFEGYVKYLLQIIR